MRINCFNCCLNSTVFGWSESTMAFLNNNGSLEDRHDAFTLYSCHVVL